MTTERVARARSLRANATRAEDMLWAHLRDRRLEDLKFTQQTPVGPWFPDFVCRQHKVIVEIDGATHGTPEEIARDTARTADLETRGYRIYRVDNRDVYRNMTGVLDGILDFIRKVADSED
jgi:very-short-patch-repair endonuclease